jgi:hypothetical protein
MEINMYLIVAGLDDLKNIDSAKYVDINTNKTPFVAIRLAQTMTNRTGKGTFDNAFVFELKSNSIKLLLASYRSKEDSLI